MRALKLVGEAFGLKFSAPEIYQQAHLVAGSFQIRESLHKIHIFKSCFCKEDIRI